VHGVGTPRALAPEGERPIGALPRRIGTSSSAPRVCHTGGIARPLPSSHS